MPNHTLYLNLTPTPDPNPNWNPKLNPNHNPNPNPNGNPDPDSYLTLHLTHHVRCPRQASDLVAERDAAATALEAQLAAANERGDAAEDALEEARLEVAELKRVSDVQVSNLDRTKNLSRESRKHAKVSAQVD